MWFSRLFSLSLPSFCLNDGDPPEAYPGPEAGSQVLITWQGESASFVCKNSKGITFATGVMSVDRGGSQPTISTSITDTLGNHLDMETVDYDPGNTLRYENTIHLGGATYQGYFEVIEGGDPLDPFADPADAASIQQLSNALAAYPKLQKAVAALTHVEPPLVQQKYPEPLKRNLKPLGCVVIATIGLVTTAATCATLAGCAFGLGVAEVSLACCAVG